MGVPERKQREKINMKKAILKTATEMYLKDGFENLSIRAIANHMEYSVGTMYIYYKDRAELINAITEEGYKKLLKILRTVKKEQDPLAFLEKIMRKYLEFAFINTEYYDLMFIMARTPGISGDVKDWGNSLLSFKILMDTVQYCIDHKTLKYDDATIASLHIWSFMHGLVSLYFKKHLLPLNNPDQAFIENSMSSFLDAIKL